MKKLFTILLLFVGLISQAQTYVYPYKVIDASNGRARQMKEGDVLRAYGTTGISFDNVGIGVSDVSGYKLNVNGTFLNINGSKSFQQVSNFFGSPAPFAGVVDTPTGSSYTNLLGVVGSEIQVGSFSSFPTGNFIKVDSSGLVLTSQLGEVDITALDSVNISSLGLVKIHNNDDTLLLHNGSLTTNVDIIPTVSGIDIGSLSSPFDTVVANTFEINEALVTNSQQFNRSFVADTAANGDTITTNESTYINVNALNILTLNVNMPSNPQDGQIFRIISVGGVGTLNLLNGTVKGSVPAISTGGTIKFIYIAALNSWYIYP